MTADDGRTLLAVLFGGRSAEHEVSCVTAAHVLRAVDRDRFDVIAVGIDRAGTWFIHSPSADSEALVAAGEPWGPTALVDLAHTRHLVVVPLIHGPNGEDGTMQGLLEILDIPYTGSGVLASAAAMDKGTAKVLCAAAGLPQARHEAHRVDRLDENELAAIARRLGFPLFVKPANMGSSVGVSRASAPEELVRSVALAAAHDEWIIIEEAVTAREIEVAVLGNLHPIASLAGEVRPGADFYDYEDKYVSGAAEILVPAPLTDDRMEEVRGLAVRAYEALRCEGMARVDFFLEEDGRGFLLNEVNTIPGFTPISMYPKMWEASGLSYRDLISSLVDHALERHARRARLAPRT
jgi:D-alanine-D-alanine ligase